MPIVKLPDGKVCVVFDRGDILIGCAHDEHSTEKESKQIVFAQQKPHPIDAPLILPYPVRLEDWAVKFYLPRKDSALSLLHVIQKYIQTHWPEEAAQDKGSVQNCSGEYTPTNKGSAQSAKPDSAHA